MITRTVESARPDGRLPPFIRNAERQAENKDRIWNPILGGRGVLLLQLRVAHALQNIWERTSRLASRVLKPPSASVSMSWNDADMVNAPVEKAT